jgi:hypothetical protein
MSKISNEALEEIKFEDLEKSREKTIGGDSGAIYKKKNEKTGTEFLVKRTKTLEELKKWLPNSNLQELQEYLPTYTEKNIIRMRVEDLVPRLQREYLKSDEIVRTRVIKDKDGNYLIVSKIIPNLVNLENLDPSNNKLYNYSDEYISTLPKDTKIAGLGRILAASLFFGEADCNLGNICLKLDEKNQVIGVVRLDYANALQYKTAGLRGETNNTRLKPYPNNLQESLLYILESSRTSSLYQYIKYIDIQEFKDAIITLANSNISDEIEVFNQDFGSPLTKSDIKSLKKMHQHFQDIVKDIKKEYYTKENIAKIKNNNKELVTKIRTTLEKTNNFLQSFDPNWVEKKTDEIIDDLSNDMYIFLFSSLSTSLTNIQNGYENRTDKEEINKIILEITTDLKDLQETLKNTKLSKDEVAEEKIEVTSNNFNQQEIKKTIAINEKLTYSNNINIKNSENMSIFNNIIDKIDNYKKDSNRIAFDSVAFLGGMVSGTAIMVAVLNQYGSEIMKGLAKIFGDVINSSPLAQAAINTLLTLTGGAITGIGATAVAEIVPSGAKLASQGVISADNNIVKPIKKYVDEYKIKQCLENMAKNSILLSDSERNI